MKEDLCFFGGIFLALTIIVGGFLCTVSTTAWLASEYGAWGLLGLMQLPFWGTFAIAFVMLWDEL